MFLLVMIIFFSTTSQNFLTVRNLMNVIKQVAIYGIASVGMTYVILLGGIDLSIGSIISLVNIVAAYVMVNLGLNPFIAILAALVISTAIGFLNGIIIAKIYHLQRDTDFPLPGFLSDDRTGLCGSDSDSGYHYGDCLCYWLVY